LKRNNSLDAQRVHHLWVLTNFRNDVRVKNEMQAMMRKLNPDYCPTLAAFTRQGAEQGVFM
jgi:hypothetical protein